MAAVLVGQFHARDAEGRVYSVHEFQESTPSADGLTGIGACHHLQTGDWRSRQQSSDDNEFLLVQSDITLIREPEPTVAS